MKINTAITARFTKRLIGSFFFLMTGWQLQAATITWDGDAADGEWTTASNWVGDVLPTVSDDVVINNGDLVTLSTGTVSVRTITLNNNSDLNISAGATLNINAPTSSNSIHGIDAETCTNCDVTNSGTLHVDGGYHGIRTESHVENSAGGILTIENCARNGIYADMSGSFGNSGTTNVSLSNSIGKCIDVTDFDNEATGSVTTTGGGIDAKDNGSGSFVNAGTVEVTNTNVGLQLDDASNSGTINIQGTTNFALQASYSFDNTGSIQGTGNFIFNGGIEVQGTIIPGASPGTMTFPQSQEFLANHTTQIEVNGTTPDTEHDQIVVTGTATLSGTLNVSINYTPTNGDRIVILTATAVSGTYSNLNPTLPDDWHVDYSVPGEVALVYEYVIGLWDGDDGDGEWMTATNWDGNILPSPSNNVLINNGETVTLSSGTANVRTVKLDNNSNLNITNGATLNINAPDDPSALDVSDCFGCQFINNGEVNITGGENGIENKGQFENGATGIITLNSWSSNGYYAISGGFSNYGTINISANGNGRCFDSNSCANFGTMNFFGGSRGVFMNGSSSFMSNSGNINITNSAYGLSVDYLNNSGVINITNPSNSALDIDDGFNNSGSIEGNGNFVINNLGVNGTIAPSGSTRTITFPQNQEFLANHTTQIEVNGTTPDTEHDQIIVTGTATISGTLDLSINYTPENNDRIVFLTATSISGTYSTITNAPSNWIVDYSVPGEVALVFTFTDGLWDGDAGDGEWTTAANWDGNMLPTSSADIIIFNGDELTLSTGTVNINTIFLSSGSRIEVSSGATLNVNNPGNSNTIQLDGASTRILNGGNINVTGGTNGVDIGGVASWTTQATGVTTITGYSNYGYGSDNSAIIRNYGTTLVEGGVTGIYCQAVSTFTNEIGGNFTVQNTSSGGILLPQDGTFLNYGHLLIDNCPGTSIETSDSFTNFSGGTLNITNAGEIGITSDGSFRNFATLNVLGTSTVGIEIEDSPYDDATFINEGILTINSNGGTAFDYQTNGTPSFSNTGSMQGIGVFDTQNNALEGTLIPGTSPGTMTFTTDQTFAAANTLEMEVNGTTPDTQHDQIIVNGTVTISGALDLSLNYNNPSNGDRMVLISATAVSETFSTINPPLPAIWEMDYSVVGEVALLYEYTPGLWDGDAGDGLWSTPANWDGDFLPGANDDVIVDNGDAVTLPSGTVTVHTITMTNNSDLTLSSGATLNVNNSGSGTTFSIIGNSAVLNNSGTLNITGGNKGIYADRAEITNHSGGVMDITPSTSGTGYEANDESDDLINYGSITITGCSTGINTKGDIYNYGSGTINCSDVTYKGIIITGDNFDNYGQVNVSNTGNRGIEVDYLYNYAGQINVTNAGWHGIEFLFRMENGADIIVTDAAQDGLNVYDVDFINTGMITISGSGDKALEVTVTPPLSPVFSNTGIIKGTGIFNTANHDLDGTLQPGTSPGTMTFPHDQTFTSANTMEMEINGTAPNTEHDQIIVNGTATISGTLAPMITYTPSNGDRIEIITATAISGTFSTVNLPFDWKIEYSATKVELVYEYIQGKWDGEVGDGLWYSADNWEGGILPIVSDDVIIGNGDAVTIPSGTLTVNSITMTNNSDLTVNSGVTLNVNNTGTGNTFSITGLSGDLFNSGTLNITGGDKGIYTYFSDIYNHVGGVINVSSVSENSYFGDGNSGNLNNNGTITVNSEVFSKGDINNNSTGIINCNNAGILLSTSTNAELTNRGQMNLTNPGGTGIRVGRLYNYSGQITISGAGNRGIDILFGLENNANITITNAAQEGYYGDDTEFTNTGNITITESGGLAMDMSLGAGSTFNNTGTIQGIGTFKFDNQSIAGTLIPGSSPGTMTFPSNQTFAASNILQMEINGTTPDTEHDQVVVNGTATISGTLNTIIGYTPTKGDRIVIISATAISGTFSTISPALTYDWSIDYSVPGEVALIYDYTLGLWDGLAGDGEWNTANNWGGRILPTSAVDVLINNGDEVKISSGTVNVQSVTLINSSKLVVEAGASLNISGYTAAGIDVEFGCTITNSGSISTTGGQYGIIYNGFFWTNNAGGTITCTNNSINGIWNTFGGLYNYGTLQFTGSMSGDAFITGGLSNYASGQITINNTSGTANSGGIYTNDNIVNNGTIDISGDLEMGIQANYYTNTGITHIEGVSGEAIAVNTALINNGGTLSGTGNYDTNESDLDGTISPGASPGTMYFEGNQTFTAASTMIIEVNGTAPNEEHDQIVVIGEATIGGTLDVTIDYTPTQGDRIPVFYASSITGTFSNISPALPANWSVDYSVVGEVALVYFNAALPVEFARFTAFAMEDKVMLEWETATENNNSHFEVEWSTNGEEFQKIGSVNGSGTTTDRQFYDFKHVQPRSGTNYYRIKQVDFDGADSYSEIRLVDKTAEKEIELSVYPNPCQFEVTVETTEATRVQLFNASGVLQLEQVSPGFLRIDVSHLPKGIYYMKTGQGVKQLIVQ